MIEKTIDGLGLEYYMIPTISGVYLQRLNVRSASDDPLCNYEKIILALVEQININEF